MYHSTYYGFNIYRKTTPGYQLPWTAGQFAADTLAGLRELIREDIQKSKGRKS